jgi:hypothetical protein
MLTMKQGIQLLILSSFIIISCQKEIDFEFKKENIPLDTSGRSLLLKVVNRSQGSPDSMIILFKYDNLKMLIEYDVSGTWSGFITENYKIVRNSQGNIYKVRSTITDPSGIETTNSTLFYDSPGTHVMYKIGTISGIGSDIRDSTVYQYNIKNKITQQRIFQSYPGSTPYLEVMRSNYVYDGNNNLIEATNYTDYLGSGNLQLDVVSTFGYDTNKNPMQFDNESIVIGRFLIGIPSKNNITREIIQYPQDPQRNEIRDHAYTYNTAGYPLTDITTLEGNRQQLTFYYQ